MAMLNAQLMAGLVVGFAIWSLMSSRPRLRDLLAAVAAASILDVLSGKHSPHGVGWLIETLSAEIAVHPHFTLGVMLAATGATLVSQFTQQVKAGE